MRSFVSFGAAGMPWMRETACRNYLGNQRLGEQSLAACGTLRFTCFGLDVLRWWEV